jgi:hypothetical protein
MLTYAGVMLDVQQASGDDRTAREGERERGREDRGQQVEEKEKHTHAYVCRWRMRWRGSTYADVC